MKKLLIASSMLLLIAAANKVSAQSVAINSSGTAADTSALLDLTSTAKGILVPRMNQTQRNAIYQPAAGLLIYQTDNTPGFYYNSGTSGSPAWTSMIVANATTQGNTFNGASQLVKLDGSSKLPAVDGSALTNLPAANAPVTVVTTSAGSNYTVTATSSHSYLFNFSGGVGGSNALTITLPAASACPAGTVMRLSAAYYSSIPQFVVTSTSTIYGVTTSGTSVTFTNANNLFQSFITDGTSWYKL